MRLDSVAGEAVSSLNGSTFVVCDRAGDIQPGTAAPQGLFVRDTRHLSQWQMTLDGRRLDVLSTDDVEYFASQFFLVPETGTIYENPGTSVVRQRFIDDGFHEDIIILNHSAAPVTLRLELAVAADFADIFEVKDQLTKQGQAYREIRDQTLILGYRRDEFVRETWIQAGHHADINSECLAFTVDIAPHGRWDLCLTVTPGDGETTDPDHEMARLITPKMERSLNEWTGQAPKLDSDWDALGHIYRRSLVDLAALRFYPDIVPGASVPAAGLPWFMALFGRDSLITGYQALPFVPELAQTTLRVLAARQGTMIDDFREEQPGRILHELRFGEMTVFKQRPQSPYYGTADATPLFLIVLDEVERWTGNRALVKELEPNARAALEWVDHHGDRDGDGYVEYERLNTETGLENQAWKDSWNSTLYRDGTMATLPRAPCEVQGYVYDAKRRCARLAREVWNDIALAEQLEREAAELKRRFNADFWMADRNYFALALDGEKHHVDSLTSNPGHLLWSGIVDESKVPALVEQLFSDELYSGWGVRTMAVGEAGYNPIEYHNGTVWPHDNSLIAAGLWRYGYRKEALRIARDILDAATYFNNRLPEVFAGYPRSLTHFPVQYPTASSPQAWATGSPLLFLRVILGLEPDGDRLRSDPHLPPGVDRIGLLGVPGPWGRIDVHGSR